MDLSDSDWAEIHRDAARSMVIFDRLHPILKEVVRETGIDIHGVLALYEHFRKQGPIEDRNTDQRKKEAAEKAAQKVMEAAAYGHRQTMIEAEALIRRDAEAGRKRRQSYGTYPSPTSK